MYCSLFAVYGVTKAIFLHEKYFFLVIIVNFFLKKSLLMTTFQYICTNEEYYKFQSNENNYCPKGSSQFIFLALHKRSTIQFFPGLSENTVSWTGLWIVDWSSDWRICWEWGLEEDGKQTGSVKRGRSVHIKRNHITKLIE